ncbi:MAG: hypothetical protein WA254_04605 [Candidatus Sulfotelmatobacter sp.]
MKFKLPPPDVRPAFVLLTLLVLLGGVSMFASMVRHWDKIPDHVGVVVFAVMYPMPLVLMLMEKQTKFSVGLAAYLVILGAVGILFS